MKMAEYTKEQKKKTCRPKCLCSFFNCRSFVCVWLVFVIRALTAQRWATADAEIKIHSAENQTDSLQSFGFFCIIKLSNTKKKNCGVSVSVVCSTYSATVSHVCDVISELGQQVSCKGSRVRPGYTSAGLTED